MPSLRNQTIRNGLIQRLQRLTPESKPQWGSLDAPRLLCHLADTFQMSLGNLSIPSANTKMLQRFPLKHLFLYVAPFPKGAKAPAELLSTLPGDFESDRERAIGLLEHLAATPRGGGAEHPFFGPLTNEEWNVLQCKHIGHHLKQFDL
jgi:hypothetical protein